MPRGKIVPDDRKVQVPVKHDLSEKFDREKFNGKTVGKCEFNDFETRWFKLQYHNFFDFLLYFHLFYIYGKATDQPRMNISSNPTFAREIKLNPTLYPFKFMDALFPVYNQTKGGCQKTPLFISFEELTKRSNEESIDLEMGDTFYPNFSSSLWMSLSDIFICDIGMV